MPTDLIPSVASSISFEPGRAWGSDLYTVLDPCAGDGEALAGLSAKWWPPRIGGDLLTRLIAVEMEGARARSLRTRLQDRRDQVIHADAFTLTWETLPKTQEGASVLYLNPPYDTDQEHGRLEQRFLARFTGALAVGGALIFVAPLRALRASSEYIARHYSEVRCWRFPDPHYAAYQQVVLVARRKHPHDDCSLAATIGGWLTYPARLAPLPEQVSAPLRVSRGTYGLIVRENAFDRTAVLAGLRLHEGLPMGTDRSVCDLLGREYPTALPPKPAHIALALASGHFNGHRVLPDAPTAGPPLLVKGMFTRDLATADEKTGPNGEVKSILRVQVPRLRMGALRLDTFDFFEPAIEAEPSAAVDISSANARDIIDRYGQSFHALMGRQFPPLHDPENPNHQMRIPDLPRRPFEVQRHAIQAALKLLARGENPKFTAEVGTGKTTLALSVIAACSPRFHAATRAELERVGFKDPRLPTVRRALVMCPPHLVDTWQEEILGDARKPGVIPWARIQVCRTISDLYREADIYILSRETAKLGHGHRGLGVGSSLNLSPSRLPGAADRSAPARHLRSLRCPRCGAPLPEGLTAEKAAAKRLRCAATLRQPVDALARLAEELAALLLPALPDSPKVEELTAGHRTLRRLRARDVEQQQRGPLDRAALVRLMGHRQAVPAAGTLLSELVAILSGKDAASLYGAPLEALCNLAAGIGEEEALADALHALYAEGRRTSPNHWSPFDYLLERSKQLRVAAGPLARQPSVDDRLEALRAALYHLAAAGTWDTRPEWRHSRRRKRQPLERPSSADIEDADKPREPERCGEPLYQAIPEPRRYPLARYITRYMRKRFDLLVLDEAHEFNNLGTAQEQAAHRLAELGIPVLALTGSIMSGYASSLFANWWSLDRGFREDFSREDQPRFVETFGFRKFIFSPAQDRARRRDAERGAVTDRVDDAEMNCRSAGEAPGILPLFILRHLLPAGVVVHKDELDIELPAMSEQQIALEAGTETDEKMLSEYMRMEEELLDQILADMFTPEFAGKLWGALMELPSYLDRCTEDLGPFELRYPEQAGGALVAAGKLFPRDYVTPKERAMLRFVDAELGAGRNVLLFIRHVSSGLPERLSRLLRESNTAQRVIYLNASRVPAPKRKEWITDKVVRADGQVLIVNPNAVRTGLNNLVHFASAWWHEIDYSAQTYRQANGRLHRVGQELPVDVRVPHYTGTAQEVAVDLVARKVTASLQVDGLDVRGALEAAGGELAARVAAEASLAMGRAIYERLRSRR